MGSILFWVKNVCEKEELPCFLLWFTVLDTNLWCRWGPWLYICELIPARCLMCAIYAKKASRSRKGCDCTKGHILENGLMLASIATRNSLVEVNSWFIGTLFYKIFHIPLALNEVKWPFPEIYKESPQFVAMM